MCPPTPCKSTIPESICNQPHSPGKRINGQLQTDDQGYMESSSSSCSPDADTPCDSSLPPTAPKVPKLRPSVPRSFARECSSSLGPGTSRTDNSEASSFESPSSVHLLRISLESETEKGSKDAPKPARGQMAEAGRAFQLGYVDGLVALQQYTSSVDESTSSTPYHVSSDASTYVIPSTLTSRSDGSNTPDSGCSISLFGCPAGDTDKTPFESESLLKQVPKPYCPPHKRQLRLLSVGQEGPLPVAEANKSSGTGKSPTAASFSRTRFHCDTPWRTMSSPTEITNGFGLEKGPFLRKLLSQSSIQINFPDNTAPKSLIPTFEKIPAAWGTSGPLPKPGQKKLSTVKPEYPLNPNMIKSNKMNLARDGIPVLEKKGTLARRGDVIIQVPISDPTNLNQARPTHPDREKGTGPPLEQLASLCHVAHSQKKKSDVPKDQIMSLVDLQIKATKPIRAPWYRSTENKAGYGGSKTDYSTSPCEGTGFFCPVIINTD
eukprot:jgi/Botrbrau1/3353/Bobra.0048s0047.1